MECLKYFMTGGCVLAKAMLSGLKSGKGLENKKPANNIGIA